MKKLFGLLAVCALVACNESSDPASAADSWANANGNNNAANNGTSAADSLQAIIDQMKADSLQNVLNQMSQQAMQMSSAAVGVSSMGVVGMSSMGVIGTSSAAVIPTSSSATVVATSSAAVAKSSATVVAKSSAAVAASGFALTLWDGAAGDPQVQTGNATGGWWYDYANDGSEVTWGAEVGADGDKTAVLEACGGICGSYTIGGTDKYPYLGIAFDYDKSGTAEDASAMKGVCVTYSFSGDNDFALELGMTTAQENKLGSALPMVTLPAGSNKTLDFAWADFEQPSWAETVMTGTNAAKQLKSLKFKVVDPAAGDEGSFTIFKVGPKGSCN